MRQFYAANLGSQFYARCSPLTASRLLGLAAIILCAGIWTKKEETTTSLASATTLNAMITTIITSQLETKPLLVGRSLAVCRESKWQRSGREATGSEHLNSSLGCLFCRERDSSPSLDFPDSLTSTKRTRHEYRDNLVAINHLVTTTSSTINCGDIESASGSGVRAHLT